MDVSELSFNAILLVERVPLGRLPEKELAVALPANPAVEWVMGHMKRKKWLRKS